MARNDFASQTLCPVARAESIAGDIWTVLVLRELFMGTHRFDEIQAMTGATPQMVAARLKNLESEGLVERQRYNERPARYEYHLTDKGRDFWPVLMALRAWGEKWCRLPGEDRAVEYLHTSCGHSAGLGPVCDYCGELLRREELGTTFSTATAAERETRRTASRARKQRGSA